MLNIEDEVAMGAIHHRLPEETRAKIARLSPENLHGEVKRLMTRPIPGDVSQESRLLLNPVLAAQWLSVFEALELPRTLRAYEPCNGSSEPVLLAVDAYTNGQGQYVGVNLNRPLAAELHHKLAKLTIKVRMIEDDATSLDMAEEHESFDLACFHHALNDLLQTAVAEHKGMDTRAIDWWVEERKMIEWLRCEYDAGLLDAAPKRAVVGALAHAIDLLKPGGVLLCDHWTWEAYRHQEWFPWELFQQLIPLARQWARDVGFPLREVKVPGLDPRWWLCLRKD
jgi:SAM-dependent methyltransferase